MSKQLFFRGAVIACALGLALWALLLYGSAEGGAGARNVRVQAVLGAASFPSPIAALSRFTRHHAQGQ